MNWFIADTHWYHRNILKYCGRTEFMTPDEHFKLMNCKRSELYKGIVPQYEAQDVADVVISDESVERMNEAMVEKWNHRVADCDDVWHLGDVAAGHSKMRLSVFERLKGRIHLIVGNHDHWWALDNRDLFASIQDVKLLETEHHKIWLSHYAHRVWPHSHRKSLHFFGHSHGVLQPWPLSLDVGVDLHGFQPISLDEALAKMTRPTA